MTSPALEALISAIHNAQSAYAVLAIVLTVVLFALLKVFHQCVLTSPLTHPLITCTTVIGAVLVLLEMKVELYQHWVALIHWILGPIVVALAVPIYQEWRVLVSEGKGFLIAILVGGFLAPISAWWCVWVLDAPLFLQFTMLAKSITTPLAMEAVQSINGVPELAAVFVIVTGVVGALGADFIFRLTQVNSPKAQGIALGTVAHAVGTAKAVSDHPQSGACATLAMGINGLMTAVLLPLLFSA